MAIAATITSQNGGATVDTYVGPSVSNYDGNDGNDIRISWQEDVPSTQYGRLNLFLKPHINYNKSTNQYEVYFKLRAYSTSTKGSLAFRLSSSDGKISLSNYTSWTNLVSVPGSSIVVGTSSTSTFNPGTSSSGWQFGCSITVYYFSDYTSTQLSRTLTVPPVYVSMSKNKFRYSFDGSGSDYYYGKTGTSPNLADKPTSIDGDSNEISISWDASPGYLVNTSYARMTALIYRDVSYTSYWKSGSSLLSPQSTFTATADMSYSSYYAPSYGDWKEASINVPEIRQDSYAGYHIDGNGWTPSVSNPLLTTSSRSYTADWKPNVYTIEFNSNGGTGTMNSMSCTYDTSYNLTNNSFINRGYEFIEWNTAPNGSGTAYENNASIENLTTEAGAIIVLYAQWRAYIKEITYDLNGGTWGTGTPITNFTVEWSKVIIPNPIPPAGSSSQFIGWTASDAVWNMLGIEPGSYIANLEIDPSKISQANWESELNVDIKANYADIGKYVYLRGTWHPVLATSVRLNGQWVTTEDVTKPNTLPLGKSWVYYDDEWHKEYGHII